MQNDSLIRQDVELRFESLATYRDVINSSEVEEVLLKFVNNIKNSGAKKNGPLISTTFGIDSRENGLFLDIEFLVPIDRQIPLETPYKFKPLFYLKHALSVRHFGNPNLLETTYRNISQFITENNLQQITSGYNVNLNDELGGAQIIDVYIGVNPSVT